ncbi:single-stranded DNA-binding protein [Glutamicibacter ardleyensis]|uniref:single-stranded DNA-binding protein n=1 Tax=Glutamicibacter ardleyensis TaxID=225894 RepID=UPI003FD0B316
MANETYVTVRGRLTSDPEMRFTPSGAGVANFTVASNSRKFDKNTNEWVNKEAKFWRCAAWNQGKLTLAENIAEGLKKGDAVIVYAEIETRSYTTKEGENRTVDELRVESIGKDLVFSKPSPQAGTRSQPPQQNQQSRPPANDPWSTGGNQSQGNGGGWDQGTAPF